MKFFETEASLFNPVSKFVSHRGFRRVLAEAEFYDLRIDIYGIRQRDGTTVAVELKLTRWQRAFEQAILYQLCADYVYIALPTDSALRVDRGLLASYGIGLIRVLPYRCQELLAAEASPVVRPHYRAHYFELLAS